MDRGDIAKIVKRWFGAGAALLAAWAAGTAAAQPDSAARARFDRIPAGTMLQMTDATRAVGSPGLVWPGKIVTIAFNGGDPAVYPLIESAASEWTANGSRIKLSFRKADGSFRTWRENVVTPQADIRIGFFTDPRRDGYWSVVGKLARRINPNEATMNFAELGMALSPYYNGARRDEWFRSYSHSTILHEFGHALGLSHEHFHPKCQADLDIEAAVTSMRDEPNNWSEDQARYNVDARTYFASLASQPGTGSVTFSPTSDRASVMLYYFPDAMFRSSTTSPCRSSEPDGYATALSTQDRLFFRNNYRVQ